MSRNRNFKAKPTGGINKRRNDRMQLQRQKKTQALNQVRGIPTGMSMVRHQLRNEVKTLDSTFTVAMLAEPYVPDILAKTMINIDTSVVIQAVNMCQQGTGVSQRIGNKIAMKSLRIRLKLNGIRTYTSLSGSRLLVIYDQEPNGTYPAISSILSSVNEAGTIISPSTLSSLDVNRMERYTVLLDEYRVLPTLDGGVSVQTTTGPTDPKTFQVDRYIKLKNLETIYSANSSPMVIANVQRGALYVISIGDVAQGTNPYSWYGEMRMRYHDI